MPKADFKTLVNSLTEGVINFGGCTVFFSSNFDKCASFVTTLKPFAMETSWQGLLFSAPFSIWGAYGAYRSHSEMGKSSQPQQLKTITAELKQAEEATVKITVNADTDDLQQKSVGELITIIQELRALVEEQQAQLTEAEDSEEKEVTHNTPLTAGQQYGGIWGEYLAHCTGFTGAMIGMLRLFWTPALEVELGLQCLLLIAGYISAMSETRLAAQSMRINNLRDSLKRHMLLSHTPQPVTPVLTTPVVASKDNVTSYQPLQG